MSAQQSAGCTAEERATFEATVFAPDPPEKIGSGILPTLPKVVSAKLPTRGMTLLEGTINGAPFRATLEPDG